LSSSTNPREYAQTWLTGKITKCDFPDARRLAFATWLYLDLSVMDYIATNKALPRSIAVHPMLVEELLDALELPQAEQSRLRGIGVVVDLRCGVPCFVSEDGTFHEI
jgi:hypothetical protein